MRRTLFLILIYLSATADAGTATSGGGGAFVWRDAEGRVTRAQLIDLWESANLDFTWGEKVGKIDFVAQGPTAHAYIDKSLARLAKFDPLFAQQVRLDLEYLMRHQHPLPSAISIQLPEDLRVAYFPSGSNAEGMMRFNGITGLLDINTEIFAQIREPLEVAATWLHEAIYKTLRESTSAHHDSILARHLNACLLSSSSTCLTERPVSVPEDRWVFKCTGRVADFYVYPLSLAPPYDPAGYRVEFLRLGGNQFTYETFQEVHKLEFHPDGTITALSHTELHGPLDVFNYYPGSVALSLSLDWQGILISASVTAAQTALAGGIDLLEQGVDNSVCVKVH